MPCHGYDSVMAVLCTSLQIKYHSLWILSFLNVWDTIKGTLQSWDHFCDRAVHCALTRSCCFIISVDFCLVIRESRIAQGCGVEQINTTCGAVFAQVHKQTPSSHNMAHWDVLNNRTTTEIQSLDMLSKSNQLQSSKVWCTCKERQLVCAGSSAEAHKSTL